MTLDDSGGAFSALNNVRVNGPLGKGMDMAKSARLLFKDPDEFFPDYFPLPLRFADTCKSAKEPLSGIHADQTDSKDLPKSVFHKISFILTQ